MENLHMSTIYSNFATDLSIALLLLIRIKYDLG